VNNWRSMKQFVIAQERRMTVIKSSEWGDFWMRDLGLHITEMMGLCEINDYSFLLRKFYWWELLFSFENDLQTGFWSQYPQQIKGKLLINSIVAFVSEMVHVFWRICEGLLIISNCRLNKGRLLINWLIVSVCRTIQAFRKISEILFMIW
jgi:hypothetical protein